MFDNLRYWLVKHWNARLLARHYLRWPYQVQRQQKYGDHSHEHACLAAYLPNVKLTDVCPLAGRKFMIGLEEECDFCPYFCRIDYNLDETTKRKCLHFHMSEEAVTTQPSPKEKWKRAGLCHRGYFGSMVYSVDDNRYFGRVLGLRTLISYEGRDEAEALSNFHKAVDEYLAFCATEGMNPDMPL